MKVTERRASITESDLVDSRNIPEIATDTGDDACTSSTRQTY